MIKFSPYTLTKRFNLIVIQRILLVPLSLTVHAVAFSLLRISIREFGHIDNLKNRKLPFKYFKILSRIVKSNKESYSET